VRVEVGERFYLTFDSSTTTIANKLGFKFYGWLERNYLELPREKGDPYQRLKVDLKGLNTD
jgi:hypothetical protein